MNTIHDMINELGARLDDDERLDAMMVYNDLYLNGRSELWICIALARILNLGRFVELKGLLFSDSFIDENTYLESEFNKTTLKSKLHEVDCSIAFNRTIDISDSEIDYINDILINPSFVDEFKYTDYKEEIEYCYLKYYFLESINYLLKLNRGTSECGFCDSCQRK